MAILAFHGGRPGIRRFRRDAPKATAGQFCDRGFFFSTDRGVAARYARDFHAYGVVYRVALDLDCVVTLTPREWESLHRGHRPDAPEIRRVGAEVAIELATGVLPPEGADLVDWLSGQGVQALVKDARGTAAESEILVFGEDRIAILGVEPPDDGPEEAPTALPEPGR